MDGAATSAGAAAVVVGRRRAGAVGRFVADHRVPVRALDGVGHFVHRRGHQDWRLAGLPMQGYTLPGLGLLTFGENWHGNHHAFPHSAHLGVESGQLDPGYWLIHAMQAVGLAWHVKGPEAESARAGLTRLTPQGG